MEQQFQRNMYILCNFIDYVNELSNRKSMISIISDLALGHRIRSKIHVEYTFIWNFFSNIVFSETVCHDVRIGPCFQLRV